MVYEKERVIYCDIIRIVAIVLILYNHRSTYWGVPDYNSISIGLIGFSLAAFICKFGAALFLMISGVLLLGRQESISYIIKHRVLRILVVMLMLTIVKSIALFYNTSNFIFSLNMIFEIFDIFTSKLSWFLYAYIMFLVMLPFLHHIAVNASVAEMKLFIFVVFTFYAIHGLYLIYGFNPLNSIMSNTSIFYANGSHAAWLIIYPIGGYFLKRLQNEDKRGTQIILLIGTMISIVLSIGLWIIDLGVTSGENYEMLRQDYIFIPCLLLFWFCMLCESYFDNCNVTVKNILRKMSSATFGMFLLEEGTDLGDLIRPLSSKIAPVLHLNSYWTSFLDIWICFTVFLGLVILIKKIPIIDRLL